MKLGLLVVFAVAVLVPSLSESRIVSKCELKEQLSKAIKLPERLEKYRETILERVIYSLSKKSGLDTSLVRVFGKRITTTTAKPTTEVTTPPASGGNETATEETTGPAANESAAVNPKNPKNPNPGKGTDGRQKREAFSAAEGSGMVEIPELTLSDGLDVEIKAYPMSDMDEGNEDEEEGVEGDEEEEEEEEEEEVSDEEDEEDDIEEEMSDEEEEVSDEEEEEEEEVSNEEEEDEVSNEEEEEEEVNDEEEGEDEVSDEDDFMDDDGEAENREKRSLSRRKPKKTEGLKKKKWATKLKSWSIGFYGLFQLSDGYFCDSGYRWSMNRCQTSCTAFTDDDISDDIACLVKTRRWWYLLRKARWFKGAKGFLEECN